MLQRTHRLPGRTRLHQFRVYKTTAYTVKVAKNNLDYSRFGFIISKKVAKLSVDRNACRRKLRAGVEALFQNIAPGYDFLFVITGNIADQSSNTLFETTKQLLAQNGYITV